MSTGQFTRYSDTALWSAVEAIVAELTATREIVVNTAPDYVIGYMCQELVAKKLISDGALEPPA